MLVARLTRFLTQLISETSGLALDDTLVLAHQSPQLAQEPDLADAIRDFHALLGQFRLHQIPIETLLDHPFSHAFADFFRGFPIPYRDEHIHLTGSLAGTLSATTKQRPRQIGARASGPHLP